MNKNVDSINHALVGIIYLIDNKYTICEGEVQKSSSQVHLLHYMQNEPEVHRANVVCTRSHNLENKFKIQMSICLCGHSFQQITPLKLKHDTVGVHVEAQQIKGFFPLRKDLP